MRKLLKTDSVKQIIALVYAEHYSCQGKQLAKIQDKYIYSAAINVQINQHFYKLMEFFGL